MDGEALVRLEFVDGESEAEEPRQVATCGSPTGGGRVGGSEAVGAPPWGEASGPGGVAHTLAEAIRAHLLRGEPIDHIPIRPAGTPFQLRVWEELRRIPVGQTITYSELAHRLGDPKAVRAVAAANGANRIGILIPCHRVVGSKGELRGFFWGLERKAKLLELESRFSANQQSLFA